MGVVVRDSVEADLRIVQQIYEHYVLHTLISMEEEPPSIAEIARRRADAVNRGLPYLAAETDGAVVGYAYATPYRSRSAYRCTVENSVYVQEGLSGRGIGRALVLALLAACRKLAIRQMIAVIAGGDNAPSTRLHKSLGFRHVGTLFDVGFKFGQSVDTLIMQKDLTAEEIYAGV
jgi:L-amino acid N-acyltransferase YncA